MQGGKLQSIIKKIKKISINVGNISVIESLNIAKVSTLPKLFYKCNAMSLRIPVNSFLEIDILILTFL
jgi:hypothetical protein